MSKHNDETGTRRNPSRRIAANYAAGRAVIAHELGLEIISIKMTPDFDPDRVAIVSYRSATQMALAAGDDRAALARGLYTDVMVNMASIAAQKLAGYSVNELTDDNIDIAFSYADRLTGLEAGWPLRSLRLDTDEPRGPNLKRHEDERDEAMHLACLQAGFELVPDELPEFNLYSRELRDASDAIVGRAETEASAKLQANWPAVMRIASALCWDNRLTPTELDHLIAHGQRR